MEVDTFSYDTYAHIQFNWKDSYINIIQQSNGTSVFPICKIRDSKIPLKAGVLIGDTQQHFLKKVFGNEHIDGLDELEEVLVEDLLGNYYCRYLFKHDILTEIEFGFHDFWLIEKLDMNLN